MNPILLARRLGVTLGLTATLCGQADVALASFGVSTTDGIVRAGGPDYTARFDGRGVDFVPALGPHAPKDLSLRFTLGSVRRGDTDVFARTSDRLPAVCGNRVQYTHRSDLTEVYEVRADGIEQSFVFAERPAGHGDLVVHGAIVTELALASASDEGIRYEREGFGGVSFGAVTGIDAKGATVRGSIRVAGDGRHVEWVLPAAFVDRCAYPLVLDPLIGSAFSIASTASADDVRPSVAYDAGTSRYLVVWTTVLSAGGSEVRAQLVSASGSLVGPQLLIADGGATDQAVANVNGSGRFLVGWTASIPTPPLSTQVIRVRSVVASTAALSGVVTVATGAGGGNVSGAVVGGDSRSAGSTQAAMVVYMQSGLFGSSSVVRCAVLSVPAAGDPGVVTGVSLPIDGFSPAVTAHGGAGARWLVTYKGLAGELLGAVVDANGTQCSSVSTVFTPASGDVASRPVSATPDGTTFLLAWSNANGGAHDVQARLVTWSGSCGSGPLTLGPLLAPVTTPGLQDSPAVAFAKDKYLLAWRNRATVGATPQVYGKGLDPVTCAPCGSEWAVDSTVLGPEEPVIAARFTAGDTASDEALVVWSNTTIRARRFEAVGGGTVTSMGGACGITGFDDFNTYSNPPVLGDATFELILANPSTPAVALVVGLSEVSIGCGPCTLVPAIDATVGGSAVVPLPIPCDLSWLGLQFTTQWLILKPGGCAAFPDYALSNALRFTVGE